MKDSEFKALIRLLDDEDVGVESHVREQLLSLGQAGIPQLELAWEQSDDDFVQGRIADIIHLIQTQDTIELLQEWKQADEPSLLKGWFLVSQYQYPEIDYLHFKHEINRLVNRAWLEMRGHMDLPEKLQIINRLLFRGETYRGTSQKKLNPDAFFLNRVIESKRGAPLGLGMLYQILCEELELPIYGIVLPNYFILSHQDNSKEFFIDPYHKGSFFKRDDLKRSLKQMRVSDDPKYYQPTTKVGIIRELIRSLASLYQKNGNEEKVRSLQLLMEKIDLD